MMDGLRRIGDQELDGQQLLLLSCDERQSAIHVMAVLTHPGGLDGATADGWWRILRALHRQSADEANALLQDMARTDREGTATIEVLTFSPAGFRLVMPGRMTVELGFRAGDYGIGVDYDGCSGPLMERQAAACESEAARLKKETTYSACAASRDLGWLAFWLRHDSTLFEGRRRRAS
jgi:hypothetical protein